jgi:electron transport complex protein RnfG
MTTTHDTLHTYAALVGLGVVCAAAIASLFQCTAPAIARNQAEALERALLVVLPQARERIAFRWNDAGRFERVADATSRDVIYAGYDAQRQLVGLAIEARGMGYQDAIRVLYGYAPAQRAIVGFTVLDSRETPGLGQRIASDAAFLRNFAALDATHTIEVVKAGKKTAAWQIDAISGATVSSQAVGAILRNSTALWLPRVAQHLGDFAYESHPDRP